MGLVDEGASVLRHRRGVMALLVDDKNDDFWRFMDEKRGGDKSETGK